MIVKNFPSSVYRTCGPEELEFLTELGWNLVALVQEDEIQFHDEVKGVEMTINVDSNGYWNGSEPTTHSVSQPFTTRKVMFLLALDPESVIKRATEKKNSAQAERDRAKEWAVAANGAQLDAEEKQRQALRNGQWEREQADKREAERDEAYERMHAMEGDIAKVREAVGGDRMKEIIGR